MSDLLNKATRVQDALTDCVSNMKRLGKCVDELVSEAAKEPEQTGDVQQATRWLEQGKRVRRLAWASDCYLAYILGDGIKIVLNDVPDRWQPLLSELCATDWTVVKK